VADLAAKIAAQMGLPTKEVTLLRLAMPLHDVGKIGVSDAVLLKPGALTQTEYAEIKLHTSRGGEILSGSRFPLLQIAETIARYHHERWDGSGYPEGLAGEAIPLAARIATVADVFDALTHARSYKRLGLKSKRLRKSFAVLVATLIRKLLRRSSPLNPITPDIHSTFDGYRGT
jgi:putative two-component system response regulator